MGVGEVSVAAATAVVGYDLLDGEWFQQLPYPRLLNLLGLAGSAAALDTEAELFVDTQKVGTFTNSATGAVLMDAHGKKLGAVFVPSFSNIHLYITDAPATNPINAVLEWTP